VSALPLHGWQARLRMHFPPSSRCGNVHRPCCCPAYGSQCCAAPRACSRGAQSPLVRVRVRAAWRGGARARERRDAPQWQSQTPLRGGTLPYHMPPPRSSRSLLRCCAAPQLPPARPAWWPPPRPLRSSRVPRQHAPVRALSARNVSSR
jgi:hypothetical protein